MTTRIRLEDDDDEPPLWCCPCGEIVESWFHCERCGFEPPWGCDCALCEEAAFERYGDQDNLPDYDPEDNIP